MIAASIVDRDLAPAEDVAARLSELRADLTGLDATAREALEPLQDVALIATLPRYQYFAQRYGLTISSLEWEAGAMPSEDELADLEQLSGELGASILIWEATPPDAALGRAQALGLQSVVFEPMASEGTSEGFIETYARAVSDLAKAASTGSN